MLWEERRNRRKLFTYFNMSEMEEKNYRWQGEGENIVEYNGIFMEIHANGHIMRPLQRTLQAD